MISALPELNIKQFKQMTAAIGFVNDEFNQQYVNEPVNLFLVVLDLLSAF